MHLSTDTHTHTHSCSHWRCRKVLHGVLNQATRWGDEFISTKSMWNCCAVTIYSRDAQILFLYFYTFLNTFQNSTSHISTDQRSVHFTFKLVKLQNHFISQINTANVDSQHTHTHTYHPQNNDLKLWKVKYKLRQNTNITRN